MTLKLLVWFVERLLGKISTRSKSAAAKGADESPVLIPVQITEIVHSGKQDVYNMTVMQHHNFTVNGGYVVKNCDALRYYCKTIIRRLVT